MKAAIRRQVYHDHMMKTMEVSIGPPLTEQEELALGRERCELHKDTLCECTLEDFHQRTLKMMVEVFSKPSYLPFIPNRG